MKVLRIFVFTVAALTLTGMAVSQQLQTRSRYVLRAGDQLDLKYRLTPDLDQTVVVEPDGFINVNIAGDLQVGGLTVKQAHDLILSRESGKLNQPELNLILKGFTQPAVTVAGEVPRPGRIEIKEHMTAISAVMNAGGFTPDAKTGKVIVFRKVDDQIAEVRQLNLSKLNKSSDLEHDMDLQPGDMVYVPRDSIAKFQRYERLANLGLYFDPTQVFK